MGLKKFNLSVYFVADPSVRGGRDICDVVSAAARGGVSLVQYRDKTNPPDIILHNAKTLKDILKPYDIPLIINDHADIAKAAGADGVHLGQGDMKPEQARDILGLNAIVGLTAFTEAQIKAVDPAVVDYIGLGPFYPTKTDKGKPVLGVERFAELAALSPVSVVGIGGITPGNAAAVISAGADGVAMMRAISAAGDPEKSAQDFVAAVNNARLREAS